jgi:NAD-dependent dihydropyrimidine dehydrogenase PreA subunit
MERKFKIQFNDANVQQSVTYVLVTEFDLKPNILKTEIAADGSGVMYLSLTADDEKLRAAVNRLDDAGFEMTEISTHIIRDDDVCWDCGACLSICPVRCFIMDPVTMEIELDNSKCVLCGSCVDACAVHALSLHL